MKRIGNVFEKIISIENLMLADEIARIGKKHQPGVIEFDKDREGNILRLHESLVNKTYRTPEYRTITIKEPKVRVISILPYIHRIVHHAIMNILRPMFVSNFTAFTYGCIKGRGIKAGFTAIKDALKDHVNTEYCLQLDVQKFYPSINHTILKQMLRRKIKDNDCLWLLDGIIDSTSGLPIGNYLSQYLSNFYLSPFDHWLKEKMKVKYCCRYVDDVAIFSHSKTYLHSLIAEIIKYLHEIKLTVKFNFKVFPVQKEGLNMLGYIFRHTHIMMRPSIKKRFAKKIHRNRSRAVIAPYIGWARPANTKNLLKKLLWQTSLANLASSQKHRHSLGVKSLSRTSLTNKSQYMITKLDHQNTTMKNA